MRVERCLNKEHCLELCGIIFPFEEKEEVRVGNTDTLLLLDVCKYKKNGKS